MRNHVLCHSSLLSLPHWTMPHIRLAFDSEYCIFMLYIEQYIVNISLLFVYPVPHQNHELRLDTSWATCANQNSIPQIDFVAAANRLKCVYYISCICIAVAYTIYGIAVFKAAYLDDQFGDNSIGRQSSSVQCESVYLLRNFAIHAQYVGKCNVYKVVHERSLIGMLWH